MYFRQYLFTLFETFGTLHHYRYHYNHHTAYRVLVLVTCIWDFLSQISKLFHLKIDINVIILFVFYFPSSP